MAAAVYRVMPNMKKMKIETPASKTIKMSSMNNEKYVEKYIKNRINNAKEIDRKKIWTIPNGISDLPFTPIYILFKHAAMKC